MIGNASHQPSGLTFGAQVDVDFWCTRGRCNGESMKKKIDFDAGFDIDFDTDFDLSLCFCFVFWPLCSALRTSHSSTKRGQETNSTVVRRQAPHTTGETRVCTVVRRKGTPHNQLTARACTVVTPHNQLTSVCT